MVQIHVGQPTAKQSPIYPKNLKNSDMVGEVVLAFIVDVDGSVQSPTVIRSNNPAFEQPAIDAVLKWKFKPGTMDGKPVRTRMQRVALTYNIMAIK